MVGEILVLVETEADVTVLHITDLIEELYTEEKNGKRRWSVW